MGQEYPLSVVLKGVDRLTGPLGRMQARMQAFGRQGVKIGESLTKRVTLPVVALGTLSFRSAARFDSAMRLVRAQTRASADEVETLRRQALKSSDAVFTPNEIASAQLAIAEAYQDANDVAAATPAVLDLAAAKQIELADAASITTGVLKAYDLAATRARDVVDLLVESTQRGGPPVEELAAGLQRAAAKATSMGVPVEQVAAGIIALSDKLGGGAKAGSALNAMLARLSGMSKEARGALQSLGVPIDQLVDAKGNVRSLTDAVAAFERRGLSVGQLMALLGEQSGTAMSLLVQQGSAALADLERRLGNAGNAVSFLADDAMEGANGAVQRFMSSIERLGIAVAEGGLLDRMTRLIEAGARWAETASRSSKATMFWVTSSLAGAAAIGPFLKGLFLLAKGANWATTALFGKRAALDATTAAATRASLASTIFGGGLKLIRTFAGKTALVLGLTAIPAVKAFGLALLTTPIGWIALGVSALIGGLVLLAKKNKAVGAFFGRVWQGTVAVFSSAWQAIVDKFHGFVDRIKALMPDWLLDLLGGSSVNATVNAQQSTSPTPAAGGSERPFSSPSPLTDFAASQSTRREVSHHTEVRETRVVLEIPNAPPGTRARVIGALDDTFGLRLGPSAVGAV